MTGEYATLNYVQTIRTVYRYNMNLQLSRAQHREEMQIVEKLFEDVDTFCLSLFYMQA